VLPFFRQYHVQAQQLQGHYSGCLISEPSRFLATIQIGITFAGFLASAFASESFADNLVQLIKTTGFPINESVLKVISVTIITIILSYFTLVFGELVPKRIAMQKAEEISMFSVVPLTYLSKITGPFVAFLTYSTNFSIRLMGGNHQAGEENITTYYKTCTHSNFAPPKVGTDPRTLYNPSAHPCQTA